MRKDLRLVYGVILAGGRGERFWPLSRKERPKQFLRLTSEKTMLEETIDRVRPIIPVENIRIVTNATMSRFIFDTANDLQKENVLEEPIGRNTCIAIGLAAVHLLHDDPDSVMVVLSADHLIRPAEKLLDILKAGMEIARVEERLITIGIVPTRPETGYGYVKLGDLYREESGYSVYQVSAFTEKPKAAVASEYYYSRKYLWNSGMFIWSSRTILSAIKNCQPNMHKLLMDYANRIGTDKELSARVELYEKAESISVDFAVLEHAANVLTIKGDIIWDDIGGWRALERYKEKDGDNNILIGQSVLSETYETTVYNEESGLVACIGVSDLVVVRSGEITLVLHRTYADQIKKVLAKLEENEATSRYL
ncbi:MAG: mannose-1-phosphate guanylyltransferase [bacterium]|nr:mannose-1-phosphate guanylyltransferase [bacterium]